ncbi:MAG: hypothetical protein QOJ97_1082 [Solirubrobacteraceae bacterium]|jgi:hypothetical protein|nr:hypothetical protein [Solirubrobacteraceae bacterium]
MPASDPWIDLADRYENNDRARMLLFAEQFSRAADLIREGGVASERMALVALDNLAEMLLYRHLRQVIRLSEEPDTLSPPQRLPASKRAELARDFNARVALGAWKGGDSYNFAFGYRRLLGGRDSEIFRVAHRYRGRTYHADSHNPALLPFICRAYLHAVGRAFVSSQPDNVGNSASEHDFAEFAPHGYAPQSDSMFPGYFVPVEAAQQIVACQTAGLGVSWQEARNALSVDLHSRVGALRGLLADLGRDGLPSNEVEKQLQWSEMWEELGGDESLLMFESERHEASRARGTDARKRYETADTAYRRRFVELSAAFTPTLSLTVLDDVGDGAARLTLARSETGLLQRYEALDAQLDKVERALTEVAIGWDRHIQQLVDEARGK